MNFKATFKTVLRKQGWRSILFCLLLVMPGFAQMLFLAAENLDAKRAWHGWGCIAIGLLEFPATFFAFVLSVTLLKCGAKLTGRYWSRLRGVPQE